MYVCVCSFFLCFQFWIFSGETTKQYEYPADLWYTRIHRERETHTYAQPRSHTSTQHSTLNTQVLVSHFTILFHIRRWHLHVLCAIGHRNSRSGRNYELSWCVCMRVWCVRSFSSFSLFVVVCCCFPFIYIHTYMHAFSGGRVNHGMLAALGSQLWIFGVYECVCECVSICVYVYVSSCVLHVYVYVCVGGLGSGSTCNSCTGCQTLCNDLWSACRSLSKHLCTHTHTYTHAYIHAHIYTHARTHRMYDTSSGKFMWVSG